MTCGVGGLAQTKAKNGYRKNQTPCGFYSPAEVV